MSKLIKVGKGIALFFVVMLIIVGSYVLYKRQSCASYCSEQGHDGSQATYERGCECTKIVVMERRDD